MTQNQTLICYCETHDGITTLEAMRLGICRLSERVRECEKAGVPFTHDPEKTNGHRVIRYRLSNRVAYG